MAVGHGQHPLGQIGGEGAAAGKHRGAQRGIGTGHNHHLKGGVAVIGLAAKTFGDRGFGALEHLHHNGGKILHLHNGVLHREAALFQRRVILDRAAV